jgi:hypothetical protein
VENLIVTALSATDPLMSYRLQQALLDDVLPRLAEDRQRALLQVLTTELRGGENGGRKGCLLAGMEARLEALARDHLGQRG